ncbi:MAG: thioredoxin family protein [Candidatus Paceibacterota bacterium]
MSKDMMIVFSVLIVILVGYRIYSLEFKTEEAVLPEVQNPQTEQNTNTNINQEETELAVVDTNTSTTTNNTVATKIENTTTLVAPKAGSYVAYDPALLADAENGDVVLFFRASWCPTCRVLDKDLKANIANIPLGVTILDVDYDDSRDLKAKYGVTYQHTLVQVDSKGNMIKKWQGSRSLNSLIAEIK